MRRLPVLAALTVAALIGTSAWLAIVAQSDPAPIPTAEHLPRDDDQAQQQASQAEAEPESAPDDADPQQESAEQGSAEEAETADESSEEQIEGDEESDPQEPADLSSNPVDVLIRALDIPRPLIESDPVAAPAPTFTTYVVEAGDTLADIGRLFDVDLFQLIDVNELESPDLIGIGRELAVPNEATEVVATTDPEAEPEPPHVPNEMAPAMTEDGVVYGTIQDHERRVFNSAIIALSEADAAVQLVEACVDGVRRTYILGLPLSDGPTRIYWRFDEGPLSTDRWIAGDGLLESDRPCPFLNRLYGLEGMKSLWIRIDGVDLTFAFENLVPDEMLANFSTCGR